MTTRVFLADDHQIVRQGLRVLIESQADMEVVGEASDGRNAVRMVSELNPDVVIMDISMPGMNGIEATRQMLNHPAPAPKVVALSARVDQRTADEMLDAGAAGYMLKDNAFEELVGAIRSVVADKVYLSPRIAEIVSTRVAAVGANGNGHAAAVAGADGQRSAFAALTPREREVLQLIAEGKATKEVAMVLSVSVKTVETHRRQLMEKLKLYSVAELTKYAVREGISALD